LIHQILYHLTFLLDIYRYS